MERLSDKAIEIINNLHTEHLDYDPEYLPLIDCAQKCSAYEDTGLEPEEINNLKDGFCSGCSVPMASNELRHIQNLLEAEKAGRLVVLPCKVGDTVYLIESIYKGKKEIGQKVVSAQIDHMTIGEAGKPVLDVCSESGNWYGPLESGDFYQTRQEAEEAMRREAEHG